MQAVLREKPKRSISSTLASLFTSGVDAGNQLTEEEGPVDQDLSDSGSVVIKRQQKNPAGYDNLVWNDEKPLDTGDSDDARPPIFLYEGTSEYDVRPPVLTLEPKQRLRLLRMQQQRRARQLPMLQRHLQSLEDSDDRNPARVLAGEHTETGSDRKRIRELQSTKIRTQAADKVRAKRWKADFQYDLSEFDILKKEKKADHGVTLDKIESPKLLPSLIKRNSFSKKQSFALNSASNAPRKELTSAQSNLLQGNQFIKTASDGTKNDTPPLSLKPTVKVSLSDKKPGKVNVPSIGFDFMNAGTATAIPDSDTPTKISTSKPSQSSSISIFEESDQSSRKRKEVEEPTENGNRPFSKSLFTSNMDKPQNKNEVKAPFLSTENGPFSFGGAAKPKSDVSLKPISSDTVEKSSKGLDLKVPSFTFGSKSSTEDRSSEKVDAVEKKDILKTDSLFSFRNTGVEQAKPEDKPSIGSSFGIRKPESTAPDTQKSGTVKPMFQFGTSVPKSDKTTVEPSGTISDKNNTPLSFSFDTAGSQKDEKLGSKLVSTKGDEVASKPQFSFGSLATKKTNEIKELPTFSFGKTATATEDKSAFSFGLNADTTKRFEPVIDKKDVLQESKSPFSVSGKPASKDLTTSVANAASTFSFGSMTAANTNEATVPSTKPAFSFGGVSGLQNTTNSQQASSIPFGGQKSNTQTNTSGFKFDLTGFKSETKQSTPAPVPAFSNVGSAGSVGSNASGFSFGAAAPATNNKLTAPQPVQSGFFGQTNQQPFAFNGSGPSTTNNSPAFGASSNQPNVPITFGGSSASSTPQAVSLNANVRFNSTQPSFNPSSAMNFNFSNQPSQSPSSIFGSNSNLSNPPNTFSGGQQNPADVFASQPSVSQGMSQFPAQRKIAMPSRRRRR